DLTPIRGQTSAPIDSSSSRCVPKRGRSLCGSRLRFRLFSQVVKIAADLFQALLDAPNLCAERTDVGFEFSSSSGEVALSCQVFDVVLRHHVRDDEGE